MNHAGEKGIQFELLTCGLLVLSWCLLPATLGAQPCGTPGRDGSGSLTGVVNTYYPGTATIAAGSFGPISVGSSSGAAAAIAAGDLLLVIQMQDANINSANTSAYGAGTTTGSGSTNVHDAGVWEYVVATGPVSGGTVAILGGGNGGALLNTYTTAAATSSDGQHSFQVIRVPQYASPTLTSGLTALGWNGSIGGVLAIDVDGTLALGSATVAVNGLGFRGGGTRAVSASTLDSSYRIASTLVKDASKGEGIAGTPRYVFNGTTDTDNTTEGYPNGSFGMGAPGNAGGGGNNDTDGCGGGGAGGANGGAGGAGSAIDVAWGIGGTAFSTAITSFPLVLGGGGGAGEGLHGAPGGGIVLVTAKNLSGTGTLSANGATAASSGSVSVGGGGAGGSVLVALSTGTTTGLTVHAQGGSGGAETGSLSVCNPGGGAGGGVAFLSAAGATVSVVAGSAGFNSGSSGTFASDGANGRSSTGAITLPGARPGYICVVSQAVVSSFRAVPSGDGHEVVEWETSSQVGTAGFYVYRFEPASRSWLQLNDRLLPAAIEAPQGALYRFRDAGASPFEPHAYSLLEIEGNGSQRSYGPYGVATDWAAAPEPLSGDYAVSPRPATAVVSESVAEAAEPLAAPAPVARTEAAEAAISPASAAPAFAPGGSNLPGGPALKLYVQARGMYAVSAAAIGAGLGMPAATASKLIAKRLVTLTSHGAPIPWQAPRDFSAIRFFGEAPTGIYSPENVYWLTLGKPGPQMQTAAAGSPAPNSSALSFPATAHFEQNLFAGVALAVSPESDYWFWGVTISGDPTYGTQSFPLEVHGVAGTGSAALTVHLQGASDAGLPGEHHLQLSLNGTPIGDTSWQGATRFDTTVTFSPALLQEGTNAVAVVGVLDPGVPFSISYTNSFDLAYRRLAVTDGSPLLVTPDLPGPMTVAGFRSANLAVYDVSRPQAPLALTGATVDTAGGTYRVTFTPIAPGRSYLALDTSRLASPRIEAWQLPAQPLRSPVNHADHLIIAPAPLAAAAGALAAQRQAQGLDSRVVSLGQVYDEFNDGLASPWAIERFLAYAAGSWQGRPASVVLAGTGNFDYKDYLGLGGNLVPPLLVETTDGLFAADRRFLAFPGGERLAIGRLPATSAQQLAGMIAKIVAYESGSGPWQRQVLLVADLPDAGGQFEWESDRAAALVPAAFSSTKIYAGQLPPGVARQQLLAGLAAGAYVFNYVGHAGLDRLSAQGLLTSQDAAVLANGDRLPVVATATCILNRFEVPGYLPLGAVLLSNPAGGAAAVWAPSGLTFSTQTSTLDRALLVALFDPRFATLGEAVLAGSQGFVALGGDAQTLLLYNLLGDPALRLRRPQ
jgi:hypothetical protein